MHSGQHNKFKLYSKATRRQRIIAAAVFISIAAFFTIIALAGCGRIDLDSWLGPCGFKQRYSLPCPSCGMTTAAVCFAQGHILKSFYIQPAAGLFCSIFLISAVLAFLTAVFGIYFEFLNRIKKLKVAYIILAVLIIIAAAWAVTLARAIVENRGR